MVMQAEHVVNAGELSVTKLTGFLGGGLAETSLLTS